jgi:pimeloyl-ACP methyl ester carboxylesterase
MQRKSGKSWKASRKLACVLFCILFLVDTGCNNKDTTKSEKPADEISAAPNEQNRDRFRELQPQAPGIHNQWWLRNDSTLLSFCLVVPTGLELETKVPLVLFLHPGSQTYSPFFAKEMVNSLVMPMLGDTRAIVVAPDILDNSWNNNRSTEQVMAILEEVCKTYPIDRERVLVTGYSIGANGVWHFVSRHPDFFTAALPIAGGPNPDYAEFKWTVPMLCLHSIADEVFPINNVRKAVDELQKIDRTVELIEINDASHYSSLAFIEPGRNAIGRIRQIWDMKATGGTPNQTDR